MKKVLTNKYFIIAIAFLIILLACFIFFKKSKKMTNLEKIKVEETSNEIADYLEEITEHDDESGKYICFAIEYLYNNTDKNVFSANEIIEVVNKYFDKEYDIDAVASIGITPYMADKGIVFDLSNASYTYNKSNIKSDIAKTKIVKFELKKIKKINNKKFEVTFSKYVVDNPYKILNYYNDISLLNNKFKDNQNNVDTKAISDYLKGKAKAKEVKKMITKDNISKIGKVDNDVIVEFAVKDNKLIIEKIK
ncbi:MAG: hypothetical protein IKN87_00700 [Bacilli bacterium]|nr:hypothetical protein [Bacilli bacterium]